MECESDLAEVESVLELMTDSPVVKGFDEKKKDMLRNLLMDMRSQLTEEINEVTEEEANHVSTGEEVKERNTVLDRNVYQHTSNLIKHVLSLVMYGRNKVDLHVCYKRDRSMSSASSFRDRTLGFGVYMETTNSKSLLLFSFVVLLASAPLFASTDQHSSKTRHRSRRSTPFPFRVTGSPTSSSLWKPLSLTR